MMSMARASSPASARARPAAAVARSDVSSPSAAMCRSRDSGTLDDPLVRRVDHRGEIVVRQHLLGKIAADPADDRTDHADAASARCGSGGALQFQHAILGDDPHEVVLRHLARQIDGAGEPFRVGAPMRLDHQPVQPQEDAAIDLARIHLFSHQLEGGVGEEIAEPRSPRPRHGRAQILGHLPRRALRGLQRNVAGKALRDDDVDGASAEVVAFDEAAVFEPGMVHLSQDPARLAHVLDALDLLDADVEKPDRRAVEAEDRARHGGAHDGEVDQQRGVGANRRADSRARCFRPGASARSPRSPGVRRRAAASGSTWPSPSAHRYCRRIPLHRPRRPGPPARTATSTTSTGPCAAPGSACRPSAPSRRSDGTSISRGRADKRRAPAGPHSLLRR